MLSSQQRRYATEAALYADECVRYFLAGYPCLRGVLSVDELKSAALMACVVAAATYDPKKGSVRAYFSKAMLHELMKACRTEVRASMHGRVHSAGSNIELAPAPVEHPLAGEIRWAVETASPKDQQVIESIVEDQSIRGQARQAGESSRQIAKRRVATLSRLKLAVERGRAFRDGASEDARLP